MNLFIWSVHVCTVTRQLINPSQLDIEDDINEVKRYKRSNQDFEDIQQKYPHTESKHHDY